MLTEWFDVSSLLELFVDSLVEIVFSISIAIAAAIYWYKSSQTKWIAKEEAKTLKTQFPTSNRRKKQQKADIEGLQKVKIFYGSQTGTAEDFSHKLAAEAKRYKFGPEVIDIEEYETSELSSENFVIFVVATYGEGEPTDNAKAFYDWLISSQEQDLLKDVKYTVFGLGNRTYDHFNEMGIYFDRRLEELGAQRIYKLGLGDDDSSLEDDFASWKKGLWPVLVSHFSIEGVDLTSEMSVSERRFRIQFYEKDTKEYHIAMKTQARHLSKKLGSDSAYDIKNPYIGSILVNKELHSPNSDRSCRHIEIDIGNEISYEPGDHLGVFPENSMSIVEEAAKRLQVDLSATFSLFAANAKDPKPFIGPCTVQQALLQWCDLTNPPRKSVLKVFSEYAKDPKEKEELLLLSSETNPQPYGKFIKDDFRSVLEVLSYFPSIAIPFDYFLEVIPRLVPRYYSISSALSEHPGRVHITSIVVSFETPTGRKHLGVCSNWLARQLPDNEKYPSVPVFIQKSDFHLPKDPTVPILMIGPGTGIAPFRGFIQERKRIHKQGSPTVNVLFFGCRSRYIDFIYEEELKKTESEGVLRLFVAFSRDQSKKVYVQHKMQEKSALLWDIIHAQKGYCYICGDARAMAKDVHQRLVNVMMEYGKLSTEDAEKYISDLKSSGRYLTDVWF